MSLLAYFRFPPLLLFLHSPVSRDRNAALLDEGSVNFLMRCYARCCWKIVPEFERQPLGCDGTGLEIARKILDVPKQLRGPQSMMHKCHRRTVENLNDTRNIHLQSCLPDFHHGWLWNAVRCVKLLVVCNEPLVSPAPLSLLL